MGLKLVQKCYVTEMILIHTIIHFFLDKYMNGFGICSTVIFVQFIVFCREDLIKKGGLTLVMAAEHRTKGNIWEALFCRILYLSLSTFFEMLGCLQRNYQM